MAQQQLNGAKIDAGFEKVRCERMPQRVQTMTALKPRPTFGPATELVLNTDEPEQVLRHLRQETSLDMLPALQWATAASQARLYILSDLPSDTVEELFATRLEQASQVQRLLDNSGSYLFLEDAQRALAVIEEGAAVQLVNPQITPISQMTEGREFSAEGRGNPPKEKSRGNDSSLSSSNLCHL